MTNILFLIKTIFIILIFNSYSFAVVSTPTPTTTLSKIANSMSYSANNTSQNVTNNTSSTTSKLINSSILSLFEKLITGPSLLLLFSII